ncbi:MAG: RdgB/HAM1 family non-canonical purine NTP pyrophosphatase [Rhodothermales bacterium]|nr:RdgB/HAM1 family non-canonical purine NTP pyrophosphatase [Rhodothermales bacterium]
MRLVLATRNAGKIRELERLLEGTGMAVEPCPSDAPEVVEDGDTLAANAEKKARAVHAFTGLAALADDTGLEVDALGGRPGVRSARFAGETATDADNRARLLRELDGQPSRARFRTVVAFVDESGALHTFVGVCEGTIGTQERGTSGFGYDALFIPDGYDQTFAELPLDTKNRISHRARALAAFVTAMSAGG